MHSLRFRIPAIFLFGVLVAGAVTALFAIRLFQDDVADRTLAELRRQAAGLASLYQEQAIRSVDEAKQAPGFAAPLLEDATGSRIYYAGVEIFPGAEVRAEATRPRACSTGDAPGRKGRDVRVRASGRRTTSSWRRRIRSPSAEEHSARWSWPSRGRSSARAGSPSSVAWVSHSSPGSSSPRASSGTSPAGSRSRCSRCRSGRPGRRGKYDAELPPAKVERRDRAPHGSLPRDDREARRVPARERNFLMVVSHELRTRSRRSGATSTRCAKGSLTRRSSGRVARRHPGRDRPAGPTRSRRPRPGAHGGRTSSPSRRTRSSPPTARAGVPELRRGGAPPRDRLRVLVGRQPRPLHRRRPRPAGCLESARQRVRLDSRRRPHRARARGGERDDRGRASRTRARGSTGRA